MMSVLMFAAVGLNPVSMALAGALVDLSVTAMFLGAGALMLVIIAVAALNPASRRMQNELA